MQLESRSFAGPPVHSACAGPVHPAWDRSLVLAAAVSPAARDECNSSRARLRGRPFTLPALGPFVLAATRSSSSPRRVQLESRSFAGPPVHSACAGPVRAGGDPFLQQPATSATRVALVCGAARSLCLRWARSCRGRPVPPAARDECNSSRSLRARPFTLPALGPFVLGATRSSSSPRRVQLESRSLRARPFTLPALGPFVLEQPATSATRVALVTGPPVHSACAGPVCPGAARDECNSSRARCGPARSLCLRGARLSWRSSPRRVQLESRSLRARSLCPIDHVTPPRTPGSDKTFAVSSTAHERLRCLPHRRWSSVRPSPVESDRTCDASCP